MIELNVEMNGRKLFANVGLFTDADDKWTDMSVRTNI
jgi:hypothetical protein